MYINQEFDSDRKFKFSFRGLHKESHSILSGNVALGKFR